MPKIKTSGGMPSSLIEFFDDITGSGAANLNIAVPKMREMRAAALRYIIALADCGEILADMDLDNLAEEFTRLADKYNEEFDEQLSAPHELSLEFIQSADKEYRIEYGELYRSSKRCEIVCSMLHTANALSWVQTSTESEPPLDVSWASADEDQVRSVMLLPSSPVDFAQIRIQYPSACEKIWPKVYQMYLAADDIFNTLNKPDFDPDVLCKAVNESIFRYEKELRGCSRGFKLVRDSTELFKKNAGRYQERMEASGNPMELYSCYFEDLQATADSMDKRTKIQFMRIVRHIRQMSAQSAALGIDPKGSRMLRMINKGMETTSKAVEEEMQRESSDEYKEMMEELRKTRSEDEARASKMFEVDRVEVLPTEAGHSTPTSVPGVPGNIDDMVAWIEEGSKPVASKKTKKRSKKSARGESA